VPISSCEDDDGISRLGRRSDGPDAERGSGVVSVLVDVVVLLRELSGGVTGWDVVWATALSLVASADRSPIRVTQLGGLHALVGPGRRPAHTIWVVTAQRCRRRWASATPARSSSRRERSARGARYRAAPDRDTTAISAADIATISGGRVLGRSARADTETPRAP
jgi:hypothetical protein